jgi:hypothetical protein
MSVCPSCAGVGAGAGRGDTLVFVRPGGVAERAEALRHIATLVGMTAPADATRVAARGQRALLRVPAASAPHVAGELERRGIPVRAVAANRVWSRIPLPFYLMVSGVVWIGTAAAAVEPIIRWTTIAFAWLLLWSAARRAREPLLGGGASRRRFPAAVERRVVDAFAALPAGAARDLLADVVRAARPLLVTPAGAAGRSVAEPMREVDELVAAACATAADLARLDDSLGAAAELRDRPAEASTQWLDTVAAAERARDAMVQRMLDAVAVLGRLGVQRAAAEPAGDQLAELTRELEREGAAQAAAAREIEELLAPAAQHR